ncbi:MAG: phosphoglycerate transporter [Chloroflexi bacterium]|nr:phosphoglycerate transporter [Chloroflexota bacterium]
MCKVGWFSTARGPGSRNLLKAVHDAIESGEIKAKLEFVFCSRDPGESAQTDIFLKMAHDYGLPLVTFSYRKFKSGLGATRDTKGGTLLPWRLDYDREIMKRLENFHPDLCVLAGYMLIAGNELCRKYDMLNLHPALPNGPAGTWQDVIWKLIESGARETGAMMHLATPDLDRGPVVSFCRFSIGGEPFDREWRKVEQLGVDQVKKTQGENNELFKLIRKHGAARELPLVVATIKAFSEGKIKITPEKKVTDARGKPIHGYDLSEEIDRIVKPVLEKN